MPTPPVSPRRASRRRGFTLIELLVVVLVLGVLATIVFVRYDRQKGRARTTTVQSDLRNLISAEEAYFSQHGTYTADTTRLDMRRSPGVVLSIGSVTPTGWSATAHHAAANPTTCAVFFGAAGAPAGFAGLPEGRIDCR